MLFARILPLLCRLRSGLLLGLLLEPVLGVGARPRPHYAIAGNERPVALLHAGQATYLVTQQSVFLLEGRQFVRKSQGPGLIQCAAAVDTVLWLGTQRGVLALNTRRFRPRPVAWPGLATTPNVVALFTDAGGALWVGANGLGVFRWAHGAFIQELNTPSINAGLATADSSVWIATNIGLSRKKGTQWTRYNEEGVANHEIPDNIVEKLLPDNAGNLWVVMSEGLCVFEGLDRHVAAEDELPSVRFLGRPGNEVYGAAYVRGAGRLFATAMGLLLLPTGPAKRFDDFAPAADKVEAKPLLVPLPGPSLSGAAPHAPYLVQVDSHERVWLVSTGEITVLTAKQFQAFIHAGQRTQRVKSPSS